MFKKWLALAMTVVLLMSNVLTISATSSLDRKGAVLKELAIMEGYPNGSLGLEDELTREQLVILVMKLMGYTADDLNKGNESFDDVPTNHWAAPWIAKAKALGITSGVTPSEFGLGRRVKTREVVTFILNILGYSDTWNRAGELGVELKLIGAIDLINFDELGALRGEFVDIAYNALTTPMDRLDYTLAGYLAETGVIDEKKAVKFGLIEPLTFEVEEINALNLRQLEVVFTGEVEEKSATDKDNYKSKKIDLRNAKFEVKDDDKVLITLEKAVSQQKEGSITVKDVENLEEEVIEDFTDEVQFIDNEFPEILDAEVVGKNTIAVFFNEPMDVDHLSTSKVKAPFLLKDEDGDKNHVKKVEFKNNNMTAYVIFYDSFKEVDYEFTISPQLDDYAGFTHKREVYDFNVSKDSDGPEIVDYKDAKPNGVTMIFDKPIKELPDEKDVYHTNSKNYAEDVRFGKDKTELVIIFGTTKTMPEVSYIYIRAEEIEDLWGNKNDTTLKYRIEVEPDDEKPVLEKIVFGDTQKDLILEFSEEVDEATAKDKKNYELRDSDGDEIKSFIRTITCNKDEVHLSLRKAITTGQYELRVEDIEDVYGNEMVAVEIDFDADDVTAPSFGNCSAKVYVDDDEYLLVVDFGESMLTDDSTYSIMNLSNYRVDMEKYNESKKKWENKTIDLNNIEDDLSISSGRNGSRAEITVDERDGYRFRNSGMVYMARVSDSAGNKTAALSGSVTYNRYTSDDTIGIASEGFRIINEREAKLTLDAHVEDFEENDFLLIGKKGSDSIYLNNYVDVDFDNYKTKPVITFEITDTDLYRFTTDAKFRFANSSSKYEVSVKTDDYGIGTGNEYGEKVSIPVPVAAADKFSPDVVRDSDGDAIMFMDASEPYIYVPFTEELSEVYDKSIYGHDFRIRTSLTDKIHDKSYEYPNVDYFIDAVNYSYTTGLVTYSNCIKIRLSDAYLNFDGYVEVQLRDKPNYITDKKENILVGGGYKEFDDVIYVYVPKPNLPKVETPLTFDISGGETTITKWPNVEPYPNIYTLVFEEKLDGEDGELSKVSYVKNRILDYLSVTPDEELNMPTNINFTVGSQATHKFIRPGHIVIEHSSTSGKSIFTVKIKEIYRVKVSDYDSQPESYLTKEVMDTKVDELEKKVEDAKKTVTDAEELVSTLESQLAELQTKIDNVDGTFKELILNDFIKLIDEKEKVKKAAEDEMLDFAAKLSRTNDRTEEELRDLQIKKDAKDVEIVLLTSELTLLTTIKDMIEKKVLQSDSPQIEELNVLVAKKKFDFDTVSAEDQELKSSIENDYNAFDNIYNQVIKLVNNENPITKEYTALLKTSTEKLDKARLDLKTAQDTYNQTEAKLVEVKATLEEGVPVVTENPTQKIDVDNSKNLYLFEENSAHLDDYQAPEDMSNYMLIKIK